jgi:SAM-dependent methyltransferase
MDIARLRQVALAARKKLPADGPAEDACDRFIGYCRKCYLAGGGEIGVEPGDLEALGWLYQFFISGGKPRGGKKVSAEDAPSATQLFTPRWIVAYLVENSLGRLWMLNRPDSRLAESMEYYIDAEVPPHFARLESPEQLRVCDPCCGSGNMLLYAYDLLYRIYQECGYPAAEIPALILTKNLRGIDIDPRAAGLAAFALSVKGGEGAPPPMITVPDDPLAYGSLTEEEGERCEVVVTNPPFMGRRKMDPALKSYILRHYPDSGADLFAVFIERCLAMLEPGGIAGLVTMQSWMFLRSFAPLRAKILAEDTILTMLHIGPKGFDSIIGAVVQTAAFTLTNTPFLQYPGYYFRLTGGGNEQEKRQLFFDALRARNCYRRRSEDFRGVPGMPVAYWTGATVAAGYRNGIPLKEIGDTRQGMATSDNARFLRRWHEVPRTEIGFGAASHEDALRSGRTWFPYNKGGDGRKWYGNAEFVVNWKDGGRELREFATELYGTPTRTLKSISEYFKPAVGWSKISGSGLTTRYYPAGFIFDVAGCSIFTKDASDLKYLLGLTNSRAARLMLETISPTLNFEAGHLAALPVIRGREDDVCPLVERLIELARADWDSFETSWDFRVHPLMEQRGEGGLAGRWEALRRTWLERTTEVRALENELDRIFSALYGMAYEPVPWHEITLIGNPWHRYRGQSADREQFPFDENLEKQLLEDTVREFISYGVGCIFGRYGAGAARGEAVPVTTHEYFSNDMAGRFREFLLESFDAGEAEAAEAFLENTLGKNLRRYFAYDFYRDHLKLYRQRPVYWQFQSPGGTFRALAYSHHYRPELIENVLALLRSMRGLPPEKTADLAEYENRLALLAARNLRLDLNDGAVANHCKLANILKPI